MRKRSVRHYALLAAKSNSRRCLNKNWRNFLGGRSLVDFALDIIPSGIFEQVIVSTDKIGYKAVPAVSVHKRDKSLAASDSCVKDLIDLIISEYVLEDGDYLWLLNPTAPFRMKYDYMKIKKIIDMELPPALVSAVRIVPYIWKNGAPFFTYKGKRRNTEDFKAEYAVENGMFYVMNIGHFRKTNSWYGKGVKLYNQDNVWSSVDIDTEDDFIQAQEIGRLWIKKENSIC
ncbi:MAG: glycosyltransferase family protein [Mobilitalea sp.]